MTEQTFGKAIADARKALKISQKELAYKILKEDGEPITPQYLNDIERDRRKGENYDKTWTRYSSYRT